MKKNVLIVLGIIVLTVFVGNLLSNTYFFKHLELLSYDLRARLNADDNADKDIVIVAIDDYSQKKLMEVPEDSSGHRPWEQDVWKNVVKFIEKGEPKALMFNMVFEQEEDRPWYDRSFAQILKKYDNIVLGTYLDKPLFKDNNFTKKLDIEDNNNIPTSTPLDVEIDDKKLDKIITYTANAPVANIYTRYNNLGVLNNILDDDSVVRKNQPIFKLVKNTKHGEKTYYMPSLAFEGFLKYMGEGDKISVKNNKIYYKDRVIPIDSNGIVNISWHNRGRGYAYIPISKILLNKGRRKDVKPEFFKDKLVIIGKTVTGRDIDLNSIISASYLSPEATAIALDNFVNDTNPYNVHSRKFVSELSKPAQFFITLIACLIVAGLGLLPKRATIGFVNGFILILLYLFFSFWLFVNPASRILIPVVVPLYYLAVTAGLIFAFRFYKEMAHKSSIMNVFGKFVAPKVLATMMKTPDKLILKNTKKKLTILFCDVRDFTNLAERNNPEKLINNLNELFKEIVNIIFENSGTVDKFMGDCIMAYWEDLGGDLTESDNDEYMAVKTALEIKKRVEELKVKNAKEGKIVFDVKIGINTGDAILGLTGTDKIMSYTAMGDAVNIASRLESACSTYKRDILISKSTYNSVKNKIKVRELGKIPIKGKNERIDIYEPIEILSDELCKKL